MNKRLVTLKPRHRRQRVFALGCLAMAIIAAPSYLFFTPITNAQSPASPSDGQELTLTMAVAIAQQNDPWLTGSHHGQRAIEAQQIAAGTLPDPVMSLSLANLPIDSFDFNQEAMTQFKVGVSQMFPQGDTLALKQKQLQEMGKQFPLMREDRRAKVAIQVSQLWLEAYRAQQSIALIEMNRSLFEQLADVAQASYSSAVGRTRQQDIIRAQLELTRLDDHLVQLKQRQQVSWQKLSEWLSFHLISDESASDQFTPELDRIPLLHSSDNTEVSAMARYTLSAQFPDIRLLDARVGEPDWRPSQQTLVELFSSHPAVKAVEQKIGATAVGVELAQQKYKPNWGLNASYGYRDDDLMGRNRDDFFSLGVTFELPLFTSNRQDQQVTAAVAQTASVKTEKWQLLRNMLANFESSRAQYFQVERRHALYQQQLLPQMHQQAEASLTAYTHDDGDFAEVVRARIAELNGQIDALDIAIERQKTIVQLNYFLFNRETQSRLTNNQLTQHQPNTQRLEQTTFDQTTHAQTMPNRIPGEE
jgi:outer membrane protein TolC